MTQNWLSTSNPGPNSVAPISIEAGPGSKLAHARAKATFEFLPLWRQAFQNLFSDANMITCVENDSLLKRKEKEFYSCSEL